MQLFLIDDATYSGTQLPQVIHNLNRYLLYNPESKIDLHLSVAFATDETRVAIADKLKAVNVDNGGRFQVKWEGDPGPIPRGSQINNYGHPGALAFEYKIPDFLS